ncbi:MAG TPA: glycosyltransferase family 2 protein [Roseiflexaceae bacterium]|nr:glycosyltransferase family 2 protein [Roseiflexaceae bacterium]
MERRSSLILLTWNGIAFLPDLLRSLRAQHRPAAEVVVVDNGSTDGSPEWIAANAPEWHLIRNPSNRGVAAAWNQALEVARGEFLVMLNQDMVFRPTWLQALEDAFDHVPQAGIVGGKLLYPDEQTIQHAGGLVLKPVMRGTHYGYREQDRGQHDQERWVDFVTGAGMAFRRSVFAAIGGFDEQFAPAYYEDTDFCLRAHGAGFGVLYVPQAVAIHIESASLGGSRSERLFRLLHRNRLRLVFKHLDAQSILQSFLPAEQALFAVGRAGLYARSAPANVPRRFGR